jgi:hypothetical protein
VTLCWPFEAPAHILRAMKERRRRRSGQKRDALRLLLEAVHARSAISSIAIIDSRGRVVAGSGADFELAVLGAVAQPAAAGTIDAACERLTVGTDVVACPLALGEQRMYLAALGSRVSRMPEAARGALRILAAS